MSYRITVDTGGTFTDVVLADENGRLVIGKAPTTERAFHGLHAALSVAADRLGEDVRSLLTQARTLIYATTRATNAIIEGSTARTAFLVTEGFPDILVLREGGKQNAFDLSQPFPDPYIPRRLTFEVEERVSAEGEIVSPLDDAQVRNVLDRLGGYEIEAVAVCLLFSSVNPRHEKRIGELLGERLPGVPFTLSHEINPIVREYRRASSAAIDASLKPLMGAHLLEVAEDLTAAGFAGELLAATSFGGAMHLEDISRQPIYSVRSGPSMAPVAAATFADADLDARDVIVCDTGGTSFDVSLIRNGTITFTRDTWLGPEFTGHLTGTSSVDIRSIGAGGGSIAWVDAGGLLRIGPHSAGAVPGPACYGRGGDEPTVTDAAVVLGFIDPADFLGGRMSLDHDLAVAAVENLGRRLGLSVATAADAMLKVANEHMVGAIQEITIKDGVDPRENLVVAGGGAAGLNIAAIARELGCARVLIPRTAGALSATGAQFSSIVTEFATSQFTESDDFDFDAVGRVMERLRSRAAGFIASLEQRGVKETKFSCFVDARYSYQVWELEIPVPEHGIATAEELVELSSRFDETHHRVFAVSEPGATIECLTWKLRLTASLDRPELHSSVGADGGRAGNSWQRTAFFDGEWMPTTVYRGGSMNAGFHLEGPAIVQEPETTLVIPPGVSATVTDLGNYQLEVST